MIKYVLMILMLAPGNAYAAKTRATASVEILQPVSIGFSDETVLVQDQQHQDFSLVTDENLILLEYK